MSARFGMSRRIAIAVLVAAPAVPWAPLATQGLTGASIQGTVVTASGAPVPRARLTLTNRSTGIVRERAAREDGRFLFEDLPVGGPYLLTVRSLGLPPSSIEGIVLHLGDRLTQRVIVDDRAPRLADIVVRGSSLRDAGAGGPAYSVSGEAVRDLPLLNRNFVGLFAMAPQATGATALSVSGQNVKFNAIQVDGGSSGDFFGVNITPGAGAGGKVLSLEALDEIRILVAPFDVRQGGFSGGLINATTRSGTNQLHGSTFLWHSRAELVGSDTSGAGVPDFNTSQYGASLGGPIVRNRLHFFAVADVESRHTQFVGPAAADVTTGISDATAQRAAQIFRDRYGFDAGGPESPSLRQPNSNFFLKLSGQASRNHSLELSFGRVDATSEILNRLVRKFDFRDGWQLSHSGLTARAQVMTTRLRASSVFGSVTNEAIASVGTIRDGSESENRTPLFLIGGDLPSAYLAGGSVKAAQGTETDQRVIELTDNVSWNRGAHLVTVGTQNQLLHFHDNFFRGAWGVWTFANVDAFDQKIPIRYEVARPLRPGGPLADYSPTQLAAYFQDRWSVTPALVLTGGLRADVPFFPSPTYNPTLASDDALGRIDTRVFPSGNAVFSPRFAFTWSVGGDRRSMLRGGVGAFAGHPAYVWMTGAYSNTGQDQTTLICKGANNVPAPTTDIANLPTSCLTSSPSSQVPSVTYFAPNFRFQQTVKYVLGFDHEFDGGLSMSLDVVHTRTRNGLYVRDVNLVERGANAEQRMMYGSIVFAAGVLASQPTRIDSTGFGSVYRFDNNTADRSTAVTLVVQKRFRGDGQLQAGYSWSRTEDVMSLSGNTGMFILDNNPLDGTLGSRNLRRSARDIPHNFVLSAVVPAYFGITAALFARARSGTPYAYTIDGDANADGASNDLAYIPRDSADVSLSNPSRYAALNAFIESEPCLRRQRGRVMSRNSCRNPSVASLDARIAKTIPTGNGRAFEVAADLFNVPNLLNNRWGLVRESINREDKSGLLSVAGWDAAANRPVYTVPVINGVTVLPSRNAVVVDASRWRVQLGVRYSF